MDRKGHSTATVGAPSVHVLFPDLRQSPNHDVDDTFLTDSGKDIILEAYRFRLLAHFLRSQDNFSHHLATFRLQAV
jgi:hypothetical protein